MFNGKVEADPISDPKPEVADVGTFTQDGQVQTTAQQNDGQAEIDLTQRLQKQMAKLKLSNIVERDLYIDSDSFKSLSLK